MDRDVTGNADMDAQERLSQAPKVRDALKKGVSVSVTTWGGREISGQSATGSRVGCC